MSEYIVMLFILALLVLMSITLQIVIYLNQRTINRLVKECLDLFCDRLIKDKEAL